MWGAVFWLDILLLLALGILGISSVIVKKKPEAEELIQKLSRFSGYVGIIAAPWGIWRLIDAILKINFLGFAPMLWFSLLVIALVFISLGMIFGYGMINSYLSEEARTKGESLRQKLVTYQVPFGFTSIGLVVWMLLYRFVII